MSYLPPRPRTLADVVSFSSAAQAHSRALVCCQGGPSLSRAALARAVADAVASLKALGVSPGDVVTIVDVNTVDFVVAFLAVACARAVAAPLNAAYKQDEFKFYIEDAKSKLVLLPASGGGRQPEAAAAAAKVLGVPVATCGVSWGFGPPPVFVTTVSPAPGANLRPLSPHTPKMEGTAVAPLASLLADPPHPSDVALFLHTSGTTSRPKGVPLTHGNLACSLTNIAATYELDSEDCSYLVMPLFHVHGLMAGLLAPLAAGGAVALPAAGRFAASAFWGDVAESRATFYTAVPTMHQVLLSRSGLGERRAAGAPRLRFVRSCSSALAAATLEKVEALAEAPCLEAYAMTEASHQMTSNPLPKHGERRPGTVGRPQGGVSVAVLAPDNTVIRVPGQIGEICIRGDNVTAGYLNNPEATREAFAGGWFHTGDQGFLDEDGYVTLTGRLKELINRGGEKISPIEVDGALLSHPAVAEAVSFGAPDEKYGEVVAAAVVLAAGAKVEGVEASIREHAAKSLAAFKVPTRIFVTDKLPKTATGKIQRRFMAGHFCGGGTSSPSPSSRAPPPPPARALVAASPVAAPTPSPPPTATGATVLARALSSLGVRLMFGVVGIPVTELASAAQACGIRYVGFRNEQAAGVAAAAAGFLTGVPAALLSVSGPGLVNALAGAGHAAANGWPLLILSGSSSSSSGGGGGGAEAGESERTGEFQELDQRRLAAPLVKWSGRLERASPSDASSLVSAALRAATRGRPGAVYLDLPAEVIQGAVAEGEALAPISFPLPPVLPSPAVPAAADGGGGGENGGCSLSDSVAAAASLLRAAVRPLAVIGKGSAYGRADTSLRSFVTRTGVPFVATSMGRGVVADDDPRCASAARSLALVKCDVAVLFGARLNWQLHFGEAPKWARGVKFILVDPEPERGDAERAAREGGCVLRCGAAEAATALLAALGGGGESEGRDAHSTRAAAPPLLVPSDSPWAAELSAKAAAARRKVSERLRTANATPLDYWTTLEQIRQSILSLPRPPVVVSEGANTMDMSRLVLGPVTEARTRLDAGTWGTMGVGPGCAIAAAIADAAGMTTGSSASSPNSPRRRIIAVEGDSAFGFSLAEVETAARFNLPITFVILNNGGVYGGDRRARALAADAARGAAGGGFAGDPPPTAFAPGARHDLIAAAFGARAFLARDAGELREALRKATLGTDESDRDPGTCVIDVVLDPMAGVESGSVHGFNAPAAASL